MLTALGGIPKKVTDQYTQQERIARILTENPEHPTNKKEAQAQAQAQWKKNKRRIRNQEY